MTIENSSSNELNEEERNPDYSVYHDCSVDFEVKDGKLIMALYTETAENSFEWVTCERPLSELLDTKIDNNHMINEKDDLVIDIDAKPLFDNIKQELQKLIDKIEGLKFK